VLAIYDAYGGPLLLPPDEKKKHDDKSHDSSADGQ
jgi:predicted small lipoprotein YifL